MSVSDKGSLSILLLALRGGQWLPVKLPHSALKELIVELRQAARGSSTGWITLPTPEEGLGFDIRIEAIEGWYLQHDQPSIQERVVSNLEKLDG